MVARLLVFLAALLLPTLTWAQSKPLDEGLFVYGSAELWGLDAPGGHGIAIVSYRGSADGFRYLTEINTDTLTLRIDDMALGPVRLGVQARGEAFIAGLLPDYFLGGENLPEFGFNASYAELAGDASLGIAPHFIHARVGAKRWFFAKNGSTDDAFVLPPSDFVIESELGYTLWLIDGDISWAQPHRTTQRRVHGFGFGVRGNLDWRADDSAWGIPGNIRNAPDQLIPRVHQWMRWGWKATSALRLQFRQEFGWADGDDITRSRVGGMNAYVSPIAGVPWAAFLESRFVTTRLALAVKVHGESEAGVVADFGYLSDVDRVGDFDTFEAVVGTGIFYDGRYGPWLVDLMLGFSPDTGWQRVEAPLVSGYLGVGYAFR